MKKTVAIFSFFLISNVLSAQMPRECQQRLKKVIESSSHYKSRFGKKDIFLDKKWSGDASSDGYNLTFTIYHENTKVGAYNRIVTYTLNGTSGKLSVEDTFSKNNSSDVSYNRELLVNLKKYCNKK